MFEKEDFEVKNFFEVKICVGGESVLLRSHLFPHADEAVFITLLEEAATKEFLDIYAPNRIIEAGIGGGYFDEHDKEGNVKKKGKKSACTLLAEALGIENDVRWKNIINFIHLNDTQGRQNPRDIAEILKIRHLQNCHRQYEHVQWFLEGLLVKYLFDYENDDFTIDRIAEIMIKHKDKIPNINGPVWKEAGETCLELHQIMFEYFIAKIPMRIQKGKIKIYKFRSGKKELKLAVYDNARNYRSAAALKAKAVLNADAAIVRNPYGQTVISVKKRKDKRIIKDIYSVIRLEEQKRKVELGIMPEIITTDWRELRADGEVVGAEEWFGFLDIYMLSNGTYTHPNIPTTYLSLDEIVDYVKIALGNTFRYAQCPYGQCPKGRQCAWYDYGLYRCQKNRIDQKQLKLHAAA